jgi:hypothetical protein
MVRSLTLLLPGCEKLVRLSDYSIALIDLALEGVYLVLILLKSCTRCFLRKKSENGALTLLSELIHLFELVRQELILLS